ncbi:MAG: TAT-variant-translocated molybdopterin oxidoreductase [Ignavibacteriae bacterium]|nr:4Fe-4S dicluster domain-containing protein [Ignavibacteriota bacterium]NOG99138.1 TAT-variant-translocated molybdopterin oxidoreductase [Ignavibacteriota bacterium]
MADKKNFWKSLKDYNNDPEFLKAKTNEFVEGVTDDFNPEEMKGLSRRKFLALVTASTAFTAAACSDYYDKGEIIPYNKRPENGLPGKANFYASSDRNGNAVLVKTREGRPIKIDGNPEHPISQGKISNTGQAAIMNLYDPTRIKSPKKDKKSTSWKTADSNIIDALDLAKGTEKKIAILTHKISSPATVNVLNDFIQKYPTAVVYSYDLFNDNNRRRAWEKCYGNSVLPSIKWDEAKVILSLESDFLAREGDITENIRLFTDGRDVMKSSDFNRLYTAEGGLSLTGMNADYRLRIRPDFQFDFVMALLNEFVNVKNSSAIQLDNSIISELKKYNLKDLITRHNLSQEKISYLVNDLASVNGKSIVYAGDTLPEEVHSAVNLLNEVLNNSAIYNFTNANVNLGDELVNTDMDSLIASLNNSEVEVLINLNTNPVFHLAAEYNFAEAAAKVNTIVTLCETPNETSDISNFVLPINHDLESWNYFKTRANVVTLQQPVIAPLYNSRQTEAILLTWLAGAFEEYKEDVYHKYVQSEFEKEIFNNSNSAADFQTYWYSSLHDGFVLTESKVENKSSFNSDAFVKSTKVKTDEDSFIVHLQPSYFIGDGEFANNGWMQELPHPVSKITWDNYAAISPAAAKALDVEIGDMLDIKVGERELSLPAFIQPGTAEKLVCIELGYGRSVIGDVGADAGFNANVLLGKNNSSSYISSAQVKKGDGNHELVSTQEHHAVDDDFTKDFHKIRNIIREGSVEQYKNDPEFLHHDGHKIFSITDDVEYNGNKWAMSIDLNKCISCAGCATSCNIENNVPVVGKDQVAVGREMSWMRIDRYYSGTPEDPEVSGQPMLCQHCDNAPCENVCPVNATNHSEDGLNQMAYNRCVGTRYCANNCPYKVRRFNFYNFRDHFADSFYEAPVSSLVNNPEVTVRSRGVMEKCTFCIQKIMDARSEAINEGREIKPNEVVTACQQSCPSNAIVFGDSNNPESEVSKYRKHNLGYHVLEELNVRPNVTYLAKLRNTHSEDA